MGCTDLRFYALLAAGNPKQTDSIRFCSHTVQAPAKPNPFRNHSMAWKPRIVRRAVWKDQKPPIRGIGRLTRTLDLEYAHVNGRSRSPAAGAW